MRLQDKATLAELFIESRGALAREQETLYKVVKTFVDEQVGEERRRIVGILRDYLVNQWQPPNCVVLWMRGEKDLVEKFISRIEQSE